MPLSHLEHVLIQTADIKATRNWYVTILGLTEGYAPDFKFPVCWLYVGDKDVIHITEGGRKVSEKRKQYLGQQAIHGSGVVDHLAFRATGLKEIIEHLKRSKIEFKQRRVSDQGLYQLFLHDPNGVKIELNFANAEAQGVKPELMATDLAA